MFGARQTGKTSLLKKVFLPSNEVLYIDLLDNELYERYLLSPQTLKKEIDLLKIKPRWVVIDEVQRVPKLLNVAHQLIESKDSIKFALTGSSSRRLKQTGVNLLAGRAWVKNLFPLTFLELGDQFVLQDILNWGSLPKTHLLQRHEDRTDFLKSYAITYIKTEIQEEQWVRKLEPFLKFLSIAAQMNGKPLNFASISRDVGVEAATVKSYYEILEDTLLGFHLAPYGKSVRKQQRSSNKFYFFDLGVKKALQKTLTVELNPRTSEWGYAFEHLVICEFYRLNEYQSLDYSLSFLLTKDNFEVDLIIERPAKPTVFIEIKSTELVHEKEFTRFTDFVLEFGGEGYVLSNDPSSRIVNGIKYLPWQEGILQVMNLNR